MHAEDDFASESSFDDLNVITTDEPMHLDAQEELFFGRTYAPLKPGNRRWLCRGVLLAGPDFSAPFWLWVIILMLFLPWAFVVAPRLLAIHWALVLIPAILFVQSVWFFVLTGCCDPGIIPRQRELEEASHHLGCVRWCAKCNVEQPVGTHHCNECDTCVMNLDHHCGVIGACIGDINMPSFSSFVLSAQCLLVAVASTLGVLAIDHKDQEEAGAADNIEAIKGGLMLRVIVFIGIFSMTIVCILTNWATNYFGLAKQTYMGMDADDPELDPRFLVGRAPRRKLYACGQALPWVTIATSQLRRTRPDGVLPIRSK
jgi:hypothetical protein